jgi:hypothetical protein
VAGLFLKLKNMFEYFVYLIISEKRLVILDHQMNDKNYHKLMDNNGGNQQLLYNTCKIFCLGYLYGSQYENQVVNSPYEFQ